MSEVVAVPNGEDFVRQAEPLRRELLVHCYRMLGSIDDAEDVVQETFVLGWRAYGRFEGRSSLRTWLYQIATNACLRALERGGRRALPSGLGAPSRVPHPLEVGGPDVTWLQPLPTDPADVVTAREHVRLAFVAALQHLPARQRAVLLLRDVLRLRAAEVAAMLGTSVVAVNSALRRARAHLEQVGPDADALYEPGDPGVRALLDRYVTAFQDANLGALEQVLRDDVALEMPPYATWFVGRVAVVGLLRARVLDRPGRVRLVPTIANGQPAFGAYLAGDDDGYRAHALHVLAVTPTGISSIHVFMSPHLFRAFSLPPVRR
ncbi:RNA polymerase subunit sigma-70 [Plantactinospora endophytica]|uniref:RNA polymerase sigma factor n=1 Tax=Plantactinospora endophytica TaxID=673535 RepID=A0ABQ4E7D9_9ACTN|nr:RNA polymerase subunit sigma-70 [Plantactinospora endophytica]GIG90608.1 RNA polymerase sigma factor [Plantactinospora endophytica]